MSTDSNFNTFINVFSSVYKHSGCYADEILRDIQRFCKDGYTGKDVDDLYRDIKDLGYKGDKDLTAMNTFVVTLDKPTTTIKSKTAVDDEDIIQSHHNIMSDIKKLYKSYDDFVAKTTDSAQQKLVDEKIEELYKDPGNWQIRFDDLTQEGRKLLFPQLKKFFEEVFTQMATSKKYRIMFRVGDSWKTKPCDSEAFKHLMTNFTEENFLYEIVDQNDNFKSDDIVKPATWSLFSELRIENVETARKKYFAIKNRRNKPGGKFFQYLTTDKVTQPIIDYLKRLQIFDKLTNEDDQEREELSDCCFVYALKMSGKIDENTLNKIRLRIKTRFVSQSKLNDICTEFLIHLDVHYIDESALSRKTRQTKEGQRLNYLGVSKQKAKYTISMNLFEEHYFIDERTPITKYYIENIDTLQPDQFNYFNSRSRAIDNQADRCLKSDKLVRLMMEKGMFEHLKYNEYLKIGVSTKSFLDDLSDLSYNPEYCCKLIEPHSTKRFKKDTYAPVSYWYADFEADVNTPTHTPYFCCVSSLLGNKVFEFYGPDCANQLLQCLPDGAVVYFHNLTYDVRFLAKYGINNSVTRGSRTMTTDIKCPTSGVELESNPKRSPNTLDPKEYRYSFGYNDKRIDFRDSYCIISEKLEKFPKMFSLDNIHKELFPYKYYHSKNFNKDTTGVINDAGKNEDVPWTDQQYIEFNKNIDAIEGCRIDNEHFNMYKYVKFYCNQDVRILREGFNKFRLGFLKDFNIDVFNYISISSLANEVFMQHVYIPNKNLYKVGGVVRAFMQQAVHGGRCMTALNKKWHVKGKIVDFDAVSLYASAMKRLYTVEGIPTVIQPDQLNYAFLKTKSAFVVEIMITKVGKHYKFPLVMQKIDGLNLNDDLITKPTRMVVDDIYLEDLIKFQQIEFEIVRGYYWDGPKDYRIQDVIQNIFNKRLEYKKAKNPLQLIYKLIMNSCYGKTIEKPTETETVYKDAGEEREDYWCKHYCKIIEDTVIDNSNIHAIKVRKPIDKHFSFSLLGIHVLSMSKRIMNEVFCLAEDLKINIYYQDTDSMHIDLDSLDLLASKYKELYDRDLIGEELGQFHTDFTSMSGRDDVQYAVESYFLMKKMYIDRLLMSDGTYEFMFRGKGLTTQSILSASKKHGGLMQLYQYLYEGNTVQFDLCDGKAAFKMNKNMTISTLSEFKRRVRTRLS